MLTAERGVQEGRRVGTLGASFISALDSAKAQLRIRQQGVHRDILPEWWSQLHEGHLDGLVGGYAEVSRKAECFGSKGGCLIQFRRPARQHYDGGRAQSASSFRTVPEAASLALRYSTLLSLSLSLSLSFSLSFSLSYT
jgi:hypothetical protein